MPVDSTHPQYAASIHRWQLTKAIVDADAKAFLKDIESSQTLEAKRRNVIYKDDAVLTNFTGRTLNGLLGAIGRRDPEIDLPSNMEYLIEDATGGNIPLNQLAKAVTGEVLEAGRAGLLVDFPSNEGDISKADEEFMGLAATLQLYPAWSIVNWSEETIQGNSMLTMVVLKENAMVLGEDGFTWTPVIQYRVLRLMEGQYVVLIYDNESKIISANAPTKENGESWDEIPFTFIGAENNDTNVDNAPLYDLAVLNLSHYKNSADYEESVHVVGQPFLVFGVDMSQEEFKEANPGGVLFGARAGLNTGVGGHANLLQAAPNTMAYEAMRLKEEQALMLGAKLITTSSGVRTAEETRMVMSSEHSVLNTVVTNVSDGMETSLGFVAEFMGSGEVEITYKLNTEFFKDTSNPQLIMAQMQMVDRGIITKNDLRDNLRKSGEIAEDRTNDDIESEVQTDPLNPMAE